MSIATLEGGPATDERQVQTLPTNYDWVAKRLGGRAGARGEEGGAAAGGRWPGEHSSKANG